MSELTAAVLAGDTPLFHPNTGTSLADARPSPSARAGLEAPRHCQLCGRRMVVRISPMGWVAACSRHGDLDSTVLER